jgi:hypothetical protein
VDRGFAYSNQFFIHIASELLLVSSAATVNTMSLLLTLSLHQIRALEDRLMTMGRLFNFYSGINIIIATVFFRHQDMEAV